MKKLISLIIILSLAIITCAGNINPKKIPAPVKLSLEKQYPGIQNVKWSLEDNNYEAEFTLNSVRTSVLLDQTGNILETEKEIAPDKLPQAIKSYISGHYPDKKIKEAATITKADGMMTYEAQIGGKDLIFDPAGNLVIN